MFLGLNPYSISINVDNLKCNRSGGKYDCSYSTHVNFERGAEVWGSFFADLGRAIGGENARQEQYTFEWVNGQLFSKKMRANSESAYIKYQAGVTANAEAAARAEKRECERYNENQAWKPGGGSFRYCN
jgi:hypothetical protein